MVLLDQFVSMLAPALANSQSVITKLALSSNHFTARSAIALSAALAAAPTSPLTDLRVASNNLGDDAVENLLRSAASANVGIVDVEECGLTDRVGMALEAIVNSTKCSLEDVYLGRNDISSVGAGSVGRACAANPKLHHVRLGGCPIGDEGVQALSDSLATASHIKSLWLGACDLSSACSPSLARLLQIWDPRRQLEEIWLGGNSLDDEAAVRIAQILHRSTKSLDSSNLCRMARVYLTNNSIGTAGCEALVAAVESNPLVLSCALSGNPGFSSSVRTRLDGFHKRNFDIASKSKKSGETVEELFAKM
jgi:Ran GTPase-activating protein (RanGAP) involved in mRNA processing and transport